MRLFMRYFKTINILPNIDIVLIYYANTYVDVLFIKSVHIDVFKHKMFYLVISAIKQMLGYYKEPSRNKLITWIGM